AAIQSASPGQVMDSRRQILRLWVESLRRALRAGYSQARGAQIDRYQGFASCLRGELQSQLPYQSHSRDGNVFAEFYSCDAQTMCCHASQDPEGRLFRRNVGGHGDDDG